MSFLSQYVLSQGTFAGAGRATALQMLTLAQRGYVRVTLEGGHAIRLVRTSKRAEGLSPEEQFLLSAVFGSTKTVVLDGPRQKPIAQSAITITRARLVKERLIRRLSPRALQRRLYWGYLVVSLIAVCIGIAIMLGVGVFVLFVAILVWLPYNVSIRCLLRSRNVFYRRKGKHLRRAPDWRDARHETCVSILGANGRYTWCDNLPTDHEAAAEKLEGAVKVMAAAFDQRQAPHKGYYRDDELWIEGLRGGHEQLAEIGDEVRNNAADYDGLAGGDSGDGGGDGGDGGGGDG
ncbi:MAG TPA: hypothetical protein VFZ58_00600 [Candidatus Saccharimonadales bacterium]